MFKFMKYEIKGTYKFMLGVILTVLGASTGLQLFAMNRLGDLENNSYAAYEFLPFVFLALIFIIFGATISALIFIISSFRKELYEDRGYLTFTLPLSGKQILGSKLLTALMWFIIFGFSIIIYNYLLAIVLFGNSTWFSQSMEIFNMFGHATLSISITSLSSSVITLLLIYFAITLSKVTLKNKKIGGIWFVLFLAINSIFSYLTYKVSTVFPYYMDMKTFELFTKDNISRMYNQMTDTIINNVNVSLGSDPGLMFVSNAGSFYVSLSSIIFNIVVGIGIFLGTSYLLERKIDL